MTTNNYHNRKKLSVWLPVVLLTLLIFLIPFNVYAGWEDDLYGIILGFFGWFVGLAGTLLNLSIKSLVIEMGTNMPKTAIDVAWAVIRDVFNLAFIFALIYIGIKTIISSDSGKLKSTLASIIIAAILMNFSLFITKAVIDVSNLVAIEIGSFLGLGNEKQGISDTFMSAMGLITVPGTDVAFETKDKNPKDRSIPFVLSGIIFMLVATYVFAAGAILLIIRFVALIFIIIMSPAMFLGMIFPQFASWAKKWWNLLFGYAFFAPVYFFMLYLSLAILQGLRDNDVFGDSKIGDLMYDAKGADESAFQVFIGFFIITALLIFSLVFAQKMGMAGGKGAVGILQSAGNKVRQKATSGAKWAAGATVGAGAKKATGSASRWSLKKFDNWQAKEPKGRAGRYARGAVRATNLDRGIRGGLEKGQNVKFGSKHSFKDDQNYATERDRRLEKTRDLQERNSVLETASVATPADVDKLTAAVKKITEAEAKDKDNDLDIKVLTKEEVAAQLTIKTIDALEENGKYSKADVQAVRDAHEKGVKDIATGGTTPGTVANPALKKALVTKRNLDEISKLPIEVFTDESMAEHLTPEKVKARLDVGDLTSDEIEDIRDSIEDYITNISTPTHVSDNWLRSDIAKRFGW